MKLWLKLPGSLGVVFVYDERVAIIAVEALSGAKPHETAAILQNGHDVVLCQAIFGGEVAEFEVARQRVAACRVPDDGLTSRRGALRERRLPAAGRDEHDQHQPKRRAIRNPCRPDSCGSHRSMFFSRNGIVRKF